MTGAFRPLIRPVASVDLFSTDKLNKLTSTVDDIEQKLKPAKPFRRSEGRVRRSLLEALPLLNNNGPIKLVLDQYRGILSPDTLHAVEAGESTITIDDFIAH